jgi:hypothetical protein
MRGGQTMLIDMTDLPPILQAHIDTLRGLVSTSLTRFHDLHRELRADYSARSEASIIHDYMLKEAKLAGFPWKLRRNLFLFRLGDFAVKLKKLDNLLRPRRIPTQLSLNFERQRAIRLFDDLDLTHLFLGYQRNGAELVTSAIWLVCPDGKNIKWAAELTAVASPMIEIAAPAVAPEPTPVRRVRAKKAPSEVKAGNGNE